MCISESATGKPCFAQGAAQRSGVGAQPPDAVRAFGQELERRQRARDLRRRRRRREDQRARRVDQVLDDLGARADVGAVGAEGLAERADDHVHLALQAGSGDRASASRPDVPGRVGLVDDKPRAVDLRELDDVGERGDVAVHREHRVGHDQPAGPWLAVAAQAPVEVLDVAVAVDDDLRAREPAAVHDRSMVELVGEDHALRAGQGADHAEVREVAGAEQHARLRALELCQTLLQAPVDRHRPRHQPRGARAHAPSPGRVGGGLADTGVVGQAEIVVRAQQQHRPAVEQHGRSLGARDHAQPAREAETLQFGKPLGDLAHRG